MRRREDFELEKKTMNFIKGDYGKIQVWAGSRIGAAKVIRDVIHAYVRKIEEDAAQKVPLVHHLIEEAQDEY